jgi:hypothetical protein
MLLSALLDGELSPAEEKEILDALSQSPPLLDAFEALSTTRLACATPAILSAPDTEQLLRSILAATTPEAMGDSVEAALQLTQLAIDGRGDERQLAHLDGLLHRPGAAPAVSGSVASQELSQAALRAVADAPSVVESLRALPEQVSTAVAASERFGLLLSACLDDALVPEEAHELDALVAVHADDVVLGAAAVHAGEALRAAAASPAFAGRARKAGDAALHAIEATSAIERSAAEGRARTGAAAAKRDVPSPWARLGTAWRVARAPLVLAFAACALFFVVSREAPAARGDRSSENSIAAASTTKALLDAMEAVVLAEAPASGDLPLLEDNTADVEAIDAAGDTMVFATESSKITVIWLSSTDDEQDT